MKNMNNNPKESATRALITINKPNNGVEMELENRRKFSEIMLMDEFYLFIRNPSSEFSTIIKQLQPKESEENK